LAILNFVFWEKNEEKKYSIFNKSDPQYDPEVTWTPVPCPRQLGNLEIEDKPEVGEKYQIPIKQCDIVIVASDGLFDNLFDEEISTIVNQNLNENVQQIAKKLVELAYSVSKQKSKITPFSQNVGKFFGITKGGKEDDITVVVMKILPSPCV